MTSQNRIQSILQMLEAEPNDCFLNYALGLEYAKSPDSYSLAESQLLKVKQIDPAYVPVYYQLGQLYANMQQRENALTFYREGLTVAKKLKQNKAANELEEAIFLLED